MSEEVVQLGLHVCSAIELLKSTLGDGDLESGKI